MTSLIEFVQNQALNLDRRPLAYILDGHTPVPSTDMLETGRLLQDVAARTVARTEVGDAEVSTVFLVFDHGIAGLPMLFETMVFSEGGFCQNPLVRYHTWEDALRGHDDIVLQINEQLEKHSIEPTVVSLPTINGVRIIRV